MPRIDQETVNRILDAADRLVTPEWTKDAIVYNIFPDSFANGPGRLSPKKGPAGLGGSLIGIVENLD